MTTRRSARRSSAPISVRPGTERVKKRQAGRKQSSAAGDPGLRGRETRTDTSMEPQETENKRAHAYVLTGPDRELLKAQASRMVEELQGPDPVHPDVVWLRRGKATVIPVGEVRERIVDDIAIRPYREPYKIYIVEEAELLGTAAQNALLKTLEEPPEYGVLILLTLQPDLLLDTVRSRTVLVRIDGEGETGIRREEELLAMVRTLPHARYAESDRIAARLTELFKEGLSWIDVLDVIRKWYRDLLYVRENAANLLYFPGEKEYYDKDAGRIGAEDVFDRFALIDEAERRLRTGANAELVLKSLFAGLRL